MSTAVTKVTSPATMETSTAVKAASAVTAALGKSRPRRPAKRYRCDDYAKESYQGRFLHFSFL